MIKPTLPIATSESLTTAGLLDLAGFASQLARARQTRLDQLLDRFCRITPDDSDAPRVAVLTG